LRQRLREIRRSDSGFTLIELLITVVILGVLAGIVVFSIANFNDEGVAAACKADAKNVEVASEAYYAKNDHTYAASMAALVTAGYLREVPQTGNGYTITYNSATGAATGALTGGGAC
jgi:prepilin-type N-terminal cleavage/methylation domain-containing protein